MRSEKQLTIAFLKSHPLDAAQILEQLPHTSVADFFEATPARSVAPVLEKMLPLAAAQCLMGVHADVSAALIDAMEPDSSVAILRSMESGPRNDILGRLGSKTANSLNTLLQHPEGTVGALMDPRAFTVSLDSTVEQALKRLRQSEAHVSSNLYIVDDSHRLMGVLGLQELIKIRPGALLRSVMHTDVYTLPAHAPLTAVAEHAGWSEHYALPVIDRRGNFIGSLRYTRLRNTLAQHARKDRINMTGLLLSLSELYWIGMSNLIKTSVSFAMRTRRITAGDSRHAP